MILKSFDFDSDDSTSTLTPQPTPPVPGAADLVWGVNRLTATNTVTDHNALTLTVVMTVADNITANIVLDNQASLAYNGWPSVSPVPTITRDYRGGSHSTAVRTVDGGIAKTILPVNPSPTATLGTLVTYTLIVPAAPITATLYGVVVTDQLNPPRYFIESVTTDGGTGADSGFNQTTGEITATFASIPHNTQAYITITTRISHEFPTAGTDPNDGNIITNTAIMTHSTATEITHTNEVSSEVHEPNVHIAKTAVFSTGNPLAADYTVTVSNTGDAIAYGPLNITDYAPPGVTITQISDGGVLLADRRTISWTLDSLDIGETRDLTYRLTLTEGIYAGDQFTNTAIVTNTSLTDTIPGVRPYVTDTVHVFPWPMGRVGDYVWFDADNSGEQGTSPGEFGINGVVINLYNSDTGDLISTTTTYSNGVNDGYYVFEYLPLGVTCTVQLSPGNFTGSGVLTPYLPTQFEATNPLSDSSASPDELFNGFGYAITTTVLANSTVFTEDMSLDYGFVPIMSLGNQVWFDTNNDSTLDSGEPTFPGVDVELYQDSNGDGVYTPGVDQLISTTTTILGGYYTFTNLLPTYYSTETYLVVITTTNFAGGGELEGYITSTVAVTANKDIARDNNNHGYTTGVLGSGGYVGSSVITLTTGAEPHNSGNANYTIDFGFVRYDFGDLPDSSLGATPAGYATFNYPTRIISDGARHVILPVNNPVLGSIATPTVGIEDAELDGQPSVGANGDDDNQSANGINTPGDDEDGVTFSAPCLIPGESIVITVTASVTDGVLNAWIDFDGNGVLGNNPVEQIAANAPVTVSAGFITMTVSVPITAQQAITTYARFRFNLSGDAGSGHLPTGKALSGEVEDYAIPVLPLDMGDLPESGAGGTAVYSTTITRNGPRHAILPINNPTLGGIVDAEIDGQPDLNALGDDLGVSTIYTHGVSLVLNDTDDEDGVTFSTPYLIPGETLIVTATALITANGGANGYLNGWIDFNGNGILDNAGEQIFTGTTLVAGNFVTVAVVVPVTATQAVSTYSRFRYSSAGGDTPTGAALDGEIEDYVLPALALDYGDLPEGGGAPVYSTTNANNGARHIIINDGSGNPTLGNIVDAETNGQPSVNATGDDLSVSSIYSHGVSISNDDEDGVIFNTLLVPGRAATITVSALTTTLGGKDGTLNAWMDFNGDGDFNDLGEQIVANTTIAAGNSVSLTFNVPASATMGNIYSRFRFNLPGDLGSGDTPAGIAYSGEVEDYVETIVELDWGDLPDSSTGNTYPTRDVDNGGRHIISPTLYLGARVDAESNGQPSVGANDDDNTLGNGYPASGDDEDGVSWTPLTPGQISTFTITASKDSGYLNGWIDFNGDGDLDDAGEHVFSATLLSTGGNNLTVTVPATGVPITGSIYLRFRYSTQQVLSPTGLALDGEIEDYVTRLIAYDWGDLPQGLYPTTVISNGPRHVITTGLYLGRRVDAEGDGQPDIAAYADDGNAASGVGASISDDEDGVIWTTLIPGQVATFTITATGNITGYLNGWIDFDGDGSLEHYFIGEGLSIGSNTFTVTVPTTATTTANIYLRFRYSTQQSLAITGEAPDGEIEDYVSNLRPYDFGDLPDGYRTHLNSDGPRHVITTGLYLGARVDEEGTGYPGVDANGDDNAPTAGIGGSPGDDDEDGVIWTTLIPGQISTFTITATGVITGYLNGWIDFDGDGTLEQYFTAESLSIGANVLTVTVPASNITVTGPIYMRFRYSTSDTLATTGEAPDGEIEDYVTRAIAYDFGDLPEGPYSTTLIANGPRHVITSGLYLGERVDAEGTGQPNLSADGDDNNAASGVGASIADDEDGVTWTTLVPGQVATFTITATGNITGYLNGWIDFDGDGTLEHYFVGQSMVIGANELTVMVPLTATLTDPVYLRFRYSTSQTLATTGEAPDGEIEDYVSNIKPYDFGDLPDGYSTLLSSDGPRHIITNGLYLGNRVDQEGTGYPSVGANGDDNTNTNGIGAGLPDDDEDGVIWTTLIPGQISTFTITATGVITGYLNGWIDFDGDGTLEQYFTAESLSIGANVLTVTVPASNITVTGPIYMRFRYSTSDTLATTGEAPDGEIEDYVTRAIAYDFGDLPEGPYSTTLIANGPRHVITSGLYLGERVDAEGTGQPNLSADGDDNNAASGVGASIADDEDGVTWTTLVPGQVATFTITATGNITGYLNGWIDFDGDGTLEHYFVGQSMVIGTNELTVMVPLTATLTDPVYLRFRYSTSQTLAAIGEAPNGEIEDYVSNAVVYDWGDLPDSSLGATPAGYATFNYPTRISDNGARHAILPVDNPTLGAWVDAEKDGQPSIVATGDDLVTSTVGAGTQQDDDEDGVTFSKPCLIPGESIVITVTASVTDGVLNAWIDFNGDGDLTDLGEQIAANDAIVAGGQIVLPVNVPIAARQAITTYARFRFNLSGDAGNGYLPVGEAFSGEVEDYAIPVLPLDMGDLPDGPYPTTLAQNGPRHAILPINNPTLGGIVDAEIDGQPDLNALGDDLGVSTIYTHGVSLVLNDTDDEDGVTFSTPYLIPGETLIVTATALITANGGANGYLNGWIDFNGNGILDNAGEQIFTNANLAAGGLVAATVNVPVTATQAVSTYSRFRFSSAGNDAPTGFAADGEIEDYVLPTLVLDYGDLPDSPYPTTNASNGARHIIVADGSGNPTLGSIVDAETDGQPSVGADGDDSNNSSIYTHGGAADNDEDGVQFTPLVPGQLAAITVTALAAASGGANGALFAWMDFNGDGDFNDAGEQVAVNYGIAAGGSAVITFTVPDTATPGDIYSRFRFSADISGANSPTGLANNGEVEDYVTRLTTSPAIVVDKRINLARVAPNQQVTYTLVITNIGDAVLNPVLVTDTMNVGLTFIPGTANPTESAVVGQIIYWNDVTGGAGMAPNDVLTITFLADVTNTTGVYSNVVVVEGIAPTGSVTDTDAVPVIVEDPSVAVDKNVTSPGVVGDLITFTIRITNTGPSALDQIPLFDHFIGDVEYVGGFPQPNAITYTTTSSGDPSGILSWDDLTAPGSHGFGRNLQPDEVFVVTTTFRLRNSHDLTMTNAASVSTVTDEGGNDGDGDDALTAVDLLYFKASQQNNDGIFLKWRTQMEFNNYGFRLLRSESGSLDDAAEIAFIPGQGQGNFGGGEYSYLDTDVQRDQSYAYWLVDIDLDGAETYHGPETVTFAHIRSIYLPIVLK